MDMIKGYRTVVYAVAVMLVGIGELTDLITVISPEYAGLALLLSGIGTLLMRYITTTAVGHNHST
jgi:hypothetical protein